jgi:singapore isolate B (sub-type 7) whole genome shotgun sequence assembly, scaffold_6
MKSLRRDFLPPQLERCIRSNGMDGTVAVQARQSEEETQFLLDLAEQYPNVIKGVVGWVDLRAENIDERVRIIPHSHCSLRSSHRTPS